MNPKLIAVRDKLRALGATVQIRRRKLRHRVKIYLHIEVAGGHFEWRTIVMPAIHGFFPDAYMTSGGFADKMYITIALER